MTIRVTVGKSDLCCCLLLSHYKANMDRLSESKKTVFCCLFVVFLLFSFPCCCCCCRCCCCCCFVFVFVLFLVDWLLLLLFVGVFVERINVGLLLEKNHASNRYSIPFAHSFRLLCISNLSMVDSPTKFYQTTKTKTHQLFYIIIMSGRVVYLRVVSSLS